MKLHSIFFTGGALAKDYPYYVVRQVDNKAIRAMYRGKLIYANAPRQIGKTSLLKRLSAELEDENWACCHVDLSTFKSLNKVEWFRYLSQAIAYTCDITSTFTYPKNQVEFLIPFLYEDIGLNRASNPIKLALFFDEIEGVLEFPFADAFLMTLRHLHQSPENYSGELFIAFAGAADPEKLVKDPDISPFAIAEKIELSDFTAEEAFTLTANLTQTGIPVADEVHNRIYEWTGGQPHLTQRICEIIEDQVTTRQLDNISTRTVDNIVWERLLNPDSRDSNVEHILGEAAKLKDIQLWKRLQAGQQVVSDEAGYDALKMTGAVKKTRDGRIKIRNRIYEEACLKLAQPTDSEPSNDEEEIESNIDQVFSPPLIIPLKLQLTQRRSRKFEIRVIEGPTESGAMSSRLPYTPDELTAILKALRMTYYEADRFTPAQQEALKRLNLLDEDYFIPDLSAQVGETLYHTLMVGEVGQAFHTALTQVRSKKGTVALQLRFDKNAAELARYPWELLYYNEELLLSGAVELTRYISYHQVVTPLVVTLPLRLLYIQSHPTDLGWLANNEQTVVRQALAQLEADGLIHVDVLSPPTYQAFLDHLETRPPHILHFDGHGVFARCCPKCRAMNYPHHSHCQAESNCKHKLGKPYGYLAFERESLGDVHWLRSRRIGNLLYKHSVRLAVLSACRSGGVGGEMLLSSTAPALIQAGVPAVVSTQLPIGVDEATWFVDGFYRALARFESIPAAVNAGRQRISPDTSEWFIPTLYLRSKDEAGYLFQKKGI